MSSISELSNEENHRGWPEARRRAYFNQCVASSGCAGPRYRSRSALGVNDSDKRDCILGSGSFR